MKYLKTYENYTQKNIDKAYYVWRYPYLSAEKIAVIKILDSTTKNIKYLALKRTDWRGKDFFTGQKKENVDGDIVLLRKWKRDKHDILFETDIKEDAIDFYNIYLKYGWNENKGKVNKDNWETYREMDKFNI